MNLAVRFFDSRVQKGMAAGSPDFQPQGCWRRKWIPGLPHWLRVERNGLQLVAAEGGDLAVVSLSALFHDSRRLNDDADPDHGSRGARLAEELHAEGILPVTDLQLALLVYACENHTEVTYCVEPTVACCWDADRLDLTRIGIAPDPDLLNTGTAGHGDRREVWGRVPAVIQGLRICKEEAEVVVHHDMPGEILGTSR